MLRGLCITAVVCGIAVLLHAQITTAPVKSISSLEITSPLKTTPPADLVRKGDQLRTGNGGKVDLNAAAEMYLNAATQRDPVGMMRAGFVYAQGIGVPKNYALARSWYQRAAKAGDHLAKNNLIRMEQRGDGGQADLATAVREFQAESTVSPDAMNNLGSLYSTGSGLPFDDLKAQDCYTKAAAGGNVVAMYNLARFAESGRGQKSANGAALDWYRKAADAGDIPAMLQLARLYYDGADVEQDGPVALDWFKRASSDGDSRGTYAVGYMLEKGDRIPPDWVEALNWYTKAADAGDSDAMVKVGAFSLTGKIGAPDAREAARWFCKAADEGNAQGFGLLARCYQLGTGVQQNAVRAGILFERAKAIDSSVTTLSVTDQLPGGFPWDAENLRWYGKLAAQGSGSAKRQLGLYYAAGRGVDADRTRAMTQLYAAVDAGDVDALVDLGIAHLKDPIEPGKPNRAFDLFERAAKAGKSKAFYQLGMWFEEISQPNYAQALEQYRQGADRNSAACMFRIGRLYAEGLGVIQDKAAAVQWYQRAANLGNAQAMACLAWACETGEGVAMDVPRAIDWYQRAANAGDTTALCELGYRYDAGLSLPKDPKAAFDFYRRAAEAGDANAMCVLGIRYAKGLGAARDYMQAMKWFRGSADLGNAYAMCKVGEMIRDGLGVRDARQDDAIAWFQKASAADPHLPENFADQSWVRQLNIGTGLAGPGADPYAQLSAAKSWEQRTGVPKNLSRLRQLNGPENSYRKPTAFKMPN